MGQTSQGLFGLDAVILFVLFDVCKVDHGLPSFACAVFMGWFL
jgi:hypothetical protein